LPVHGRDDPDPRADRGGGGRPRQPEGLADRQPPDRPGRDLRQGVAARGVHADHLRGDGRHHAGATPGALRPPAQVTGLRLLASALVVVALALFPLGAGNYPVKLLQEILIWGIFAMSLDLLMGYAGMVSFGHSAFFGIGAYTAALLLPKWPGLLAALGAPALAAAVGALAIGFLSIRVGGVYFIMLTLAFSQMFFALTFQNAFLGAEDGITSVPRPHVFGLSIASLGAFHVYLLAIVGAAALSLHRIVRSPFGHVLRGSHDNEERMQAV